MYNSYFAFSESPFENNLDQRFLFLGQDHQEVLSALLYFIETKKGFASVCGDVGTGKTMLINSFLDRLPETVKPVIISNPYVSSLDLLLYLAKTLEIRTTGGENVLELTDQIKNALLEAKSQDKHLVLIVDEAHLLSDQVIEEIRLLSNIETPDRKLLQILLVGQYELSHNLDRPEMRHLRQRININRFLSHLNFAETTQYIDYRLHKVGSSFANIFKDNCKATIFKVTKGVPRLINQLCDNALLISMTEGQRQVNRKTLKKAAEALQTDRIFTPPSSLRKESFRFWKYYKFLAFVGAGAVLGLIGGIAVMIPEKLAPPAFEQLKTHGGETLSSFAPQQLIAQEGETLSSIASQHYPKDPRFGVVAIILQNVNLINEVVVKAGEVLDLPKINFENRTIHLKDNLWYAPYGRYTSQKSVNRIAFRFFTKKIKFLVRHIKSKDDNPIKRIFIGGYATEEELTNVLNSLTTKKK
jgi:type II secretory pathway predicted ATPase ExeA